MAYRRKSLELNHGACLPEEEKHIRDVHLSCFLILRSVRESVCLCYRMTIISIKIDSF